LWLSGQLSFNLKIEKGTRYLRATADIGWRGDVVPQLRHTGE